MLCSATKIRKLSATCKCTMAINLDGLRSIWLGIPHKPAWERNLKPVRRVRNDRDYKPFFSNQRKRTMKTATKMTMTIQWLIPKTPGSVIFPKLPQVSTVAFMSG
jgi:hypothetical protein